MAARTFTDQLARLVEARSRAGARVSELEADRRTATQTLMAASEALVQAERRGARAAERQEFQASLVEAKATSAQPWPELIEGARRRVRDAQGEVVRFVEANLVPLIEVLETEGEAAAANLNAAAQALVDAFQERERVAREITALYAMTVSVAEVNAVPSSRAGALLSAANALLHEGGERPPMLRRELVRTDAPEPEAVASVVVESASVA
jgi:hypothetical protein